MIQTLPIDKIIHNEYIINALCHLYQRITSALMMRQPELTNNSQMRAYRWRILRKLLRSIVPSTA